ncbi:homoserine dehydrogenase [Aquibacillus sp. 3ASR75-11]|uniref:Homoserine dehydrogenase n=1 Tax=Terrihalobacillus insolitus TaxID=2950438 RepID=A0A9X4ANI1_9BACI|nr:homoserine dehydrogenase [Terrihalobacillus insolitus]MDC3415070.1 homoserine dehydrogenase [Terrihalobacillus insolitus]MDC3425844.1 homoserine dehydrogenase [Terrihalobacillus insolitus]
MTTKIAFIGFGGVGQALAKLLDERSQSLRNKYGLETEVVAVSDVMKGSIYHPDGLNTQKLLDTVRETGNVENYPDQPGIIKGWNSLETIQNSNADMIVEVTFTDVKTGQPAIDHHKAAFENKKSVVTTNKGPVALAYNELNELAEQNGVFWGFEGTVMSGTPALRMPVTTLAGNEIHEIKGILNGTTNYILTEMEKGQSYDGALKKAQELGYAEADPTSDVEGYDARYKAAILSNYLMGTPVSAEDIPCEGISNITQEMIQQALKENKKWRLLARVTKENGNVTASIKPEKIDADDPLAGVTGSTNAILYECDLAGPILLTGAGAGLIETGYSLLIDIIHYQKQNALAKI